METSDLQIVSRGIAVERLGRARKIAWFIVAAALPVLAVAARMAFGVPVTVDLPVLAVIAGTTIGIPPSWAFLSFLGSLATFLVGSALLLGLRFDPAQAARIWLRRPGSLIVSDAWVVLQHESGRTSRYPRSDVAEGWLDRSGGTTTAVLRMRSEDLVSIDTGNVKTGRKLLRAAGVAADQQRWQTRLANPAAGVFGGGCLAAASSVILAALLCAVPFVFAQSLGAVLEGDEGWDHLLWPAAWLAGDLLGFLLLLRALVPALLVVGSDGVTIRGFGRRRLFVRHADVTEVRRDHRALRLVLRGGGRLALPTGYASELRDVVGDRILEAMRAREKKSAADEGASDVLDRGGRPPGEWREHLRRLGREAAGYRARSVAPERLAAVLEDVSRAPERRVAAALALSGAEDPGLRRRIRAAASSCADDALRHALEAAAADEIGEDELVAVTRRRG